MGSTYRFIADPSEPSEVLAWFRALDRAPREIATDDCLWLHFADEGPLVPGQAEQSPVATYFAPRVRRGVLWTLGEVHFRATPRTRFPGVQRIGARFGRWLAKQPCVFSNKRDFEGEWIERMEGSIRNYDPKVYAFRSGLRGLEAGRYFVRGDDTGFRLDNVCKTLRLRGIVCEDD